MADENEGKYETKHENKSRGLPVEEIKKKIEEYKKKPIKAPQIEIMKNVIRNAKKKELGKDERSDRKEYSLTYRGRTVPLKGTGIGNYLGGWKVADSATTAKLVIADDYAKQGRFEDVYTLLGNAFEKFAGYSMSSTNTKSGRYNAWKDKKDVDMYEAIKRRALKYADKAVEKNTQLAGRYIQLVEDIDSTIEKLQEEEKSDTDT